MEMKEQISIVEYNDLYKDQIVKLVGECLVDQGVIPANSLPLDDDDLQHIPELFKDKGKFWVALGEDKVVGTVGVRGTKEPTVAILRRMFVNKELRGTGLGQRLLETALQFARENGYKKITLNTYKTMKRAHHFYEKNKFLYIGMKVKDMLSFEKDL